MKLQPNFSWQKYEDKDDDAAKENQRNQFQYQLQQQHISVANTVNSTIDDISYFSQERATSETWIDGKQIWNKTVAIPTLTVGALNVVNHGITFTRLIACQVVLSNTASPANWRTLPYLNPTDVTKGAGFDVGATTINILTGVLWDANYSGYATLWYLKT